MSSASHSNRPAGTRLVSVIIPCYNEAANIRDTIEAVEETLEELGERHEILVVDDGSGDDSISVVREIARSDEKIRPVEMMRNFGQAIAYQTGLDLAEGGYVLFFSGDLEIPAEEIGRVIHALDDGQDFVNTSRKDRWGGSHALKSRLANSILNRITGTTFVDRGSGLKGMRREIARSFRLYGEWHRFIPDLASVYTERLSELEVPFHERKAGISSYRGRLKSISVFLDLPTVAFTVLCHRKPYLLLPGRLFGFTGIVIGLIGFAITAWLVVLKLFFGEALSERPLFLVSILTTILGLIMVMIGSLGELVLQIANRLESSGHQRTRCVRKINPNRDSTS